jgi:hypothetical protein
MFLWRDDPAKTSSLQMRAYEVNHIILHVIKIEDSIDNNAAEIGVRDGGVSPDRLGSTTITSMVSFPIPVLLDQHCNSFRNMPSFGLSDKGCVLFNACLSALPQLQQAL